MINANQPVGATIRPEVCPAALVFDLVAHKWTLAIIHQLHQARGPVRFRQLQRMVEPITQKELTKRLRELERAGLVGRSVFAEVPPRVEYRLTELGATLIPALAGLHAWAETHGRVILENRQKSDDLRANPVSMDAASEQRPAHLRSGSP